MSFYAKNPQGTNGGLHHIQMTVLVSVKSKKINKCNVFYSAVNL